VDFGVGRSINQRGAIGRFGVGQATRILQHVAELDADVGAPRDEGEGERVGLRRAAAIADVAQAVARGDVCIGGDLIGRGGIDRRLAAAKQLEQVPPVARQAAAPAGDVAHRLLRGISNHNGPASPWQTTPLAPAGVGPFARLCDTGG